MSNIDTRSPFFPKGQTSLTGTSGSKDTGSIRNGGNAISGEANALRSGDAKVSIPEGVRDFSRIKKAADASPDIDNSDKIARLKAQIQAGTYEVDYDAVADKMLMQEF